MLRRRRDLRLRFCCFGSFQGPVMIRRRRDPSVLCALPVLYEDSEVRVDVCLAACTGGHSIVLAIPATECLG